MFFTFANQAHVLFTYVRTSAEKKAGGISLLLIEKTPGEEFAPPQLTGSRIRTVGYHGMHTYALFFDELGLALAQIGRHLHGQRLRPLP